MDRLMSVLHKIGVVAAVYATLLGVGAVLIAGLIFVPSLLGMDGLIIETDKDLLKATAGWILGTTFIVMYALIRK